MKMNGLLILMLMKMNSLKISIFEMFLQYLQLAWNKWEERAKNDELGSYKKEKTNKKWSRQD